MYPKIKFKFSQNNFDKNRPNSSGSRFFFFLKEKERSEKWPNRAASPRSSAVPSSEPNFRLKKQTDFLSLSLSLLSISFQQIPILSLPRPKILSASVSVSEKLDDVEDGSVALPVPGPPQDLLPPPRPPRPLQPLLLLPLPGRRRGLRRPAPPEAGGRHPPPHRPPIRARLAPLPPRLLLLGPPALQVPRHRPAHRQARLLLLFLLLLLPLRRPLPLLLLLRRRRRPPRLALLLLLHPRHASLCLSRGSPADAGWRISV